MVRDPRHRLFAMNTSTPSVETILAEAVEIAAPAERQAFVEQACARDEALDGLAREEPACAELVKLRFFAGLTQEKSAQALRVTRRTADHYWAFARAWLLQALGGAERSAER